MKMNRVDDRTGFAARAMGEGWTGSRRAPGFVIGLLSTIALLLSTAGSASALTLGVQWTGNPEQMAQEMDMVQKAGASTFRLPISPAWSKKGAVEWEWYDAIFRAAAEHGVTILPHFQGRMNGVDDLPTKGEEDTWSEWAKVAVRRYGYNGTFWSQYPSVPAHPVFAWEMLNEPNNNSFMNITGAEYGEFLQWAGPAVQTASESWGGQKTGVLFGGLLAWSGGTNWQTFFLNAYKVPGTASAFTGLAIHPYELDPSKFPGETRIQAFTKAVSGARTFLNSNGAAGKSLWITEVGWPAEFEWSVGEPEQANLLKEAVGWAKTAAASLNLKALIWYNQRDIGVSTWQYHSGLRKECGAFRPAWYSFQEQTGAPTWPVPPSYEGLTSSSAFYFPCTVGVRDYFVAASDNKIHELSYNYGLGWAESTALTAAVAPNTSPNAFAWPNGGMRGYFVAASDNKIHELGYNYGLGWAESGALTTAVAPNTSPSTFAWPGGGMRGYFVAASDNKIHELGYNYGLGWAESGALTTAVAPNTSPNAFAWPNGGMRGYFVAASDNKIHELGYNYGLGWAESGALTTAVAPNTSPSTFAWPGGGMRGYFVAASDNKIHELSYNYGLGWAESGALTTVVAANTTPSTFAWPGGGMRGYFVAASDNKIHELGYNYGLGWAESGALTTAVAPNTSPSTFAWPGGGMRGYFVAASDNKIHELSYNSGLGWAESTALTAKVR